jgi:hypothetical protein
MVVDGFDMRGPLTAPGRSQSYLPATGWIGLGGGPDYSTDLLFGEVLPR